MAVRSVATMVVELAVMTVALMADTTAGMKVGKLAANLVEMTVVR